MLVRIIFSLFVFSEVALADVNCEKLVSKVDRVDIAFLSQRTDTVDCPRGDCEKPRRITFLGHPNSSVNDMSCVAGISDGVFTGRCSCDGKTGKISMKTWGGDQMIWFYSSESDIIVWIMSNNPYPSPEEVVWYKRK